MPECSEIVKMMSGYLDRDLPPETCSMIEKHLDSCKDCATAADGLRRTVALCRQYRSDAQPGPLPFAKQAELKQALERAIKLMRGEERGEAQ